MTPPLTTALLLAALSYLSPAAAEGTLSFSIAQNPAVRAAQIEQRSQYLRRSLSLAARRDGTVLADLGNAVQAGLYYANISVGTPAQALNVQIDTGSSDVWVPGSGLSVCNSRQEGGCPGGSFNAQASSTFVDVGKGEFNISYVDETGVTGDYFQDTFAIGGSTLNSFQMGIALEGTIGIGIMGIGYNNSEANTQTGNGTIYPNLPSALVNSGLIKTAAYSLWLNDLQSSEGEILFGGVDTAKYSGDLISIDVYPSSRSGRITSFTVAFTSLSATSPSGSDQLTPSNYAQAAILDSGTTITLLPNDVARVVFEVLGATESQELGAVVVPCSLANVNGTLDYGFGGTGGPVIKVQVSDLVLPLTLSDGSTPRYSNGAAACQLGIMAAGNLPVLFGDTFLRSAYAVYDLENNKIALAQTDFNATDSNIVAFASGGAAIPSAVAAANQEQVTQTADSIPKVGVSATAVGSGQATYNPTATGFSAASGFAAGATSTSTKKSAAGSGPEPFAWSRVVIGFVSLLGMGVGGGIFAIM